MEVNVEGSLVIKICAIGARSSDCYIRVFQANSGSLFGGGEPNAPIRTSTLLSGKLCN